MWMRSIVGVRRGNEIEHDESSDYNIEHGTPKMLFAGNQ